MLARIRTLLFLYSQMARRTTDVPLNPTPGVY